MINLIIVGVGDLANKIIPAVKKLKDNNQVKQIVFVDIKSVDDILKKLNLSNDLKDWFFKQSYHNLLTDNENNQTINQLYSNLSDDINTVVYLSTSPCNYFESIERYCRIAKLFFIEKPWAKDPSELEKIKILKDTKNIIVLGVDHYLWKNTVKSFIEKKKSKIEIIKLKSNNFDFVITEKNIPNEDRKYYWDYGEISDMLPHVFPLLDELFAIKDDALDNKNNIQINCGVYNLNSLRENRGKYRNIVNKETFVEIEWKLEQKIIHIILGKGLNFVFQSTSKSKFFSDNKEIIIDFESNSNNYHDPYTEMFCYISQNSDKITQNKDGKLFLNIESMQKYVNFIDKIQKIVDSIYGKNVKRAEILKRKFYYNENEYIRLQFHPTNNCQVKVKVD
ncbi:MAG: hypothetical protein ACPKPY_01420 [Nitrososphaeraceae archaeon]